MRTFTAGLPPYVGKPIGVQEKAKIYATRYNYACNTNSDYSSIWSSFS